MEIMGVHVSTSAHAVEMDRRQVGNVKKSRSMARLINRIAKISKELKLIEGGAE